MTGELDSLILQEVLAIREQFDSFGELQLETMRRLGNVEVGVGKLAVQFDDVSKCIDRIDAHLDWIEQHLGRLDA